MTLTLTLKGVCGRAELIFDEIFVHDEENKKVLLGWKFVFVLFLS